MRRCDRAEAGSPVGREQFEREPIAHWAIMECARRSAAARWSKQASPYE
jgi:hypothetical protein